MTSDGKDQFLEALAESGTMCDIMSTPKGRRKPMAKQANRLTAWNRNMYERRTATGLTIHKAVFMAWALLPEMYRKTTRTLERYETVATEESADPMFLAALAEVYKCRLDELSKLAAQRMAAIGILVPNQQVLAINSFAA